MNNQKLRQTMQGDIFFFLHIPKTAGTSFYKMLNNEVFPNKTLILEDRRFRKELEAVYPDQVSNFLFFRQHADYYFYQYLPRRPHYLTFFREPVSRIVSLFNHIVNNPNHPSHSYLGEDKSIKTFIESRNKFSVMNDQVVSVVGNKFGYSKLTQRDILDIAKFRLNEFSFFGLREYYQESIELLSNQFGWDNLNITEKNITTNRVLQTESLTQEEINLIEENNTLDIEFYHYALQIFKDRAGI